MTMAKIKRIIRVVLKAVGIVAVLGAVLTVIAGDWRNAAVYIVLAAAIILLM